MLGDLFRRDASLGGAEYVGFARGQRSAPSFESGGHQFRIDYSFALEYASHSVSQLLGRSIFDDEAAHVNLERSEQVAWLAQPGKHQHPAFGHPLVQLISRAQS